MVHFDIPYALSQGRDHGKDRAQVHLAIIFGASDDVIEALLASYRHPPSSCAPSHMHHGIRYQSKMGAPTPLFWIQSKMKTALCLFQIYHVK